MVRQAPAGAVRGGHSPTQHLQERTLCATGIDATSRLRRSPTGWAPTRIAPERRQRLPGRLQERCGSVILWERLQSRCSARSKRQASRLKLPRSTCRSAPRARPVSTQRRGFAGRPQGGLLQGSRRNGDRCSHRPARSRFLRGSDFSRDAFPPLARASRLKPLPRSTCRSAPCARPVSTQCRGFAGRPQGGLLQGSRRNEDSCFHRETAATLRLSLRERRKARCGSESIAAEAAPTTARRGAQPSWERLQSRCFSTPGKRIAAEAAPTPHLQERTLCATGIGATSWLRRSPTGWAPTRIAPERRQLLPQGNRRDAAAVAVGAPEGAMRF